MTGWLSDVGVVLCDLDGVVWLQGEPIRGAVDAVARIRTSGRQVLFVTNNSLPTIRQHQVALARIGIDARGAVVSSAGAAASLVSTDDVVLVCGGLGIVEAVEAVGAKVVTPRHSVPTPDVVIVGLDKAFSYRTITVAARAVSGGARFVGTNSDPTYPTPLGSVPGAGALIASVAVASGAEPLFAGKHCGPMADLVRRRIGVDALEGEKILMLGDRPSTDGAFADKLGARFALVRTGVTPPGAKADRHVDLDVADLVTVADAMAHD